MSGSKPEFTAEQMATALKNNRGFVSAAARTLGCTPQTVRNYIKRYATVAIARDEAREEMLDVAEANLYKKITSGDTTAIIFTLKTVGKERGYIERQEVSGPRGEPITVIEVAENDFDINEDTSEETP
jgi:predicted transcriptional regulator